jgi:predicted amidohydrolase
MSNVRVAAIQIWAKVGDVTRNLRRAESLVREAFRRGAEWAILPEFFTSSGGFAPSMLSAWLPLEGPALELLRNLALEHNGVVGGSFIAKSGQDCFNSYLLVTASKYHLQGDKAVELAMLRLEYDTHAAAAKNAHDVIAVDLRQFNFAWG